MYAGLCPNTLNNKFPPPQVSDASCADYDKRTPLCVPVHCCRVLPEYSLN